MAVVTSIARIRDLGQFEAVGKNSAKEENPVEITALEMLPPRAPRTPFTYSFPTINGDYLATRDYLKQLEVIVKNSAKEEDPVEHILPCIREDLSGKVKGKRIQSSEINERFQMLREIVPHSEQKRDEASFLSEVIKYIQLLQEKVHMYEEGSFPSRQDSTSNE